MCVFCFVFSLVYFCACKGFLWLFGILFLGREWEGSGKVALLNIEMILE